MAVNGAIQYIIITPYFIAVSSAFVNNAISGLPTIRTITTNAKVVKTDNNRIIKRVIGLPGESVMYEEGKLYINGKCVEDSYSLSSTKDFDNIVLKEDEYFVLGDNREVSKDSRMIGPVKKEQILGKTRLVIFPFTKIRIEK